MRQKDFLNDPNPIKLAQIIKQRTAKALVLCLGTIADAFRDWLYDTLDTLESMDGPQSKEEDDANITTSDKLSGHIDCILYPHEYR